MGSNRIEQLYINLLDANFTGFVCQISGDHRYIHIGKKFSGVVEASLTTGGKINISLVTPAAATGKYCHFRPAMVTSVNSAIIARLYENISSTGGSSVTLVNMNRNHTATSESTMKSVVTATVSGDPIVIIGVGPGGGRAARGGGLGGADEEIILKAETEYIMEIEEVGGAATDIIAELRWYEEDAT